MLYTEHTFWYTGFIILLVQIEKFRYSKRKAGGKRYGAEGTDHFPH